MSRRAKTTAAAGGAGGEDRFLAALSHELRTPLNGVLGMAGLLARTRLDANKRAYVSALQESGEHLLGLVNDVLDLAKLDAGGYEPHPAPTDLERLLQGAAELLSPRAHAKGLEIAWAADPDLPKVMADEGRLRQILFNLAGNAVKFTAEGGVLLTARMTKTAATARIRLSVRDTGPGVDEVDRERIFQPFAQGPASLAGAMESTGLGLAIVKRLAAALDGQIGLDTRPGEGSDFWFEADFPLAGEAERAGSLEGLCVAVVSPNVTVAEAAARQIRACGGEALTYATAQAAKAAPAGAPMLIDYASRGRRPAPGHASIIMVAPEQRSRISTLRRAGFHGYLIKPLRRRSLAERVLAVTGRANEPQAHRTAEDERARSATGVGTRVLLAEDNPINALLAKALLEREGCSIDHVRTGDQAIAAASDSAYDLILMDLRMPGRDGLSTAAELRSRGVRTPIAALTADAFEDRRRACLQAGMNDFLTKPLDPTALRALLARWTKAPARAGFTDQRPEAKLAS